MIPITKEYSFRNDSYTLFIGDIKYVFSFKNNEIIKQSSYSIKMLKQFKESN